MSHRDKRRDDKDKEQLGPEAPIAEGPTVLLQFKKWTRTKNEITSQGPNREDGPPVKSLDVPVKCTTMKNYIWPEI